MHGLSFSVACGILVPSPGIELEYSALDGRFSITGLPGSPFCIFKTVVEHSSPEKQNTNPEVFFLILVF